VRLLTDCRTAFADQDVMPTTVLLDKLNNDPEAPWRDHGPHGLTARRLAVLLGEYEIHSTTIRFDGLGQAKGFRRIDFTDAWRRYCAPPVLPTAPAARGVPVPSVPTSNPRSTRYGSKAWYG
jgi:hypothetical protein